MLRDTTMLRAVQIAIIMLILVCSCLSMLRSVWRCFRPIFHINQKDYHTMQELYIHSQRIMSY